MPTNESIEDIKREVKLILCRTSDIERNANKILVIIEKLDKHIEGNKDM